MISTLLLRQYKHESAGGGSKELAITEGPIEEKMGGLHIASVGGVGVGGNGTECVLAADVDTEWHWISRTNSMKLKWISYKNTLLGAIAVATKHLYPISTDYKSLMFLSGIGLGFTWLDLEDDEDGEDGVVDIVEMHQKYFSCDSQMDRTLMEIEKFTKYRFERHAVSEMLGDGQLGIERLLKLERDIVAKLDGNVCTLTTDELGHFALVVGYSLKPKEWAALPSPTMYILKVKRFGVFDGDKAANERAEYIAVDLYCQRLVITMEPPEKSRANSIQHSFCPQMLEQIVSDIIARFDDGNQLKFEDQGIVDLCGRAALQRMAAAMAEAKRKEHISSKLGRLTVLALIRLFDARKAVIEYVGYVEGKISNAFHSVTGSEEEWKFPPKLDISSDLEEITAALQRETEAVRRQEKLFSGYILNFDGRPLPKVLWATYDRAGLKAALDDILREEDRIFEHLRAMKRKLSEYNEAKN